MITFEDRPVFRGFFEFMMPLNRFRDEEQDNQSSAGDDEGDEDENDNKNNISGKDDRVGGGVSNKDESADSSVSDDEFSRRYEYVSDDKGEYDVSNGDEHVNDDVIDAMLQREREPHVSSIRLSFPHVSPGVYGYLSESLAVKGTCNLKTALEEYDLKKDCL